jgi:hypothetical protein
VAQRDGRRGSSLLLALAVVVLIVSAMLGLGGRSGGACRELARQLHHHRAYYLAESGLEAGLGLIWNRAIRPGGRVVLADLDPPHRVIVSLNRARVGVDLEIRSTARVAGTSVTLKARLAAAMLPVFGDGPLRASGDGRR